MPTIDFKGAKEVFYDGTEALEVYLGNTLVWKKPESAPSAPTMLSITGEFLGYGWYGPDEPLGINWESIKVAVKDPKNIKEVIMKGKKYTVTKYQQDFISVDVTVTPPVREEYTWDETITIRYTI